MGGKPKPRGQTLRLRSDIVLRATSNRDAGPLMSLVDHNRTRLRQWMPWVDATRRVDDALVFTKRATEEWRDGTAFRFTMYRDGRVIGVCSLQDVSRANGYASIGYWITKDEEGQGIVSDAVAALLDYAFESLALELVAICAAPENTRSCALPNRLGFRYEAVLRRREWLYDHYVDHAIYSMTCDEWSLRRNRLRRTY